MKIHTFLHTGTDYLNNKKKKNLKEEDYTCNTNKYLGISFQ